MINIRNCGQGPFVCLTRVHRIRLRGFFVGFWSRLMGLDFGDLAQAAAAAAANAPKGREQVDASLYLDFVGAHKNVLYTSVCCFGSV